MDFLGFTLGVPGEIPALAMEGEPEGVEDADSNSFNTAEFLRDSLDFLISLDAESVLDAGEGMGDGEEEPSIWELDLLFLTLSSLSMVGVFFPVTD